MGKKTESQTLRWRRVNPGPNLQIIPSPCLFWGISGFLVPSESFPPGLVLTKGCSVHQPYRRTGDLEILECSDEPGLKTAFLPSGQVLISGGGEACLAAVLGVSDTHSTKLHFPKEAKDSHQLPYPIRPCYGFCAISPRGCTCRGHRINLF